MSTHVREGFSDLCTLYSHRSPTLPAESTDVDMLPVSEGRGVSAQMVLGSMEMESPVEVPRASGGV